MKYSYSFTAASVGSLLLSDLLAGVLYDAEARRQGVGPESLHDGQLHLFFFVSCSFDSTGESICLGGSCFGVPLPKKYVCSLHFTSSLCLNLCLADSCGLPQSR